MRQKYELWGKRLQRVVISCKLGKDREIHCEVKHMFDVAIVGGGPAGLSAAITLKMRGKSLIWFGSPAMSPKVEKSHRIGNYPGLGVISGEEMNARFRAHAQEMELEMTDKLVTMISRPKDFMLLADNEVFEARAVLLCTGVISTKGFAGEEEYLGRGVSYCATCDGFFYKGKTIAVFCGAKRYEDEVEYLAQMAETVYLYAGYPDCAVALDNVKRLESPIVQVKGGLKMNAVVLKDGTEVPVDGLFCLRGAVAPTSLMPGLETEGAHIVTKRDCSTNVEGCFAAGDCTGAPYQIAKAVGEGNIAAHSILEFLSKK